MQSELLSTTDLIKKLNEVYPDGLQISRSHGIMNSTKCVYKRNEQVFLFDISEHFKFSKDRGTDEDTFIEYYKNQMWIVEDVIG